MSARVPYSIVALAIVSLAAIAISQSQFALRLDADSYRLERPDISSAALAQEFDFPVVLNNCTTITAICDVKYDEMDVFITASSKLESKMVTDIQEELKYDYYQYTDFEDPAFLSNPPAWWQKGSKTTRFVSAEHRPKTGLTIALTEGNVQIWFWRRWQ